MTVFAVCARWVRTRKTMAHKKTLSPHPRQNTTVKKPRRIKSTTYKSFQLQRRVKSTGPTLPSAFRLLRQAIGILKRNWKIFAIILLVYGVVDFVVVQGFSAGHDYTSAKQTLKGLFSGSSADVASGTALFLYMLGSTAQPASTAAGPYQFMWIMISSLAFIWTLRQVYAHNRVRARDAFYRGMYPLIPFVLVLAVVALELVPAILGGVIFSVVSGGVASTEIERVMWALVFGLLILLSVYLLVSSIFALYIICLPDMTPIKALSASRQLAFSRRWAVLRKVIFLPAVLLIVGGLIMVPVILFVPVIASWLFFGLTLAALPVLHSYYYALYRSLL